MLSEADVENLRASSPLMDVYGSLQKLEDEQARNKGASSPLMDVYGSQNEKMRDIIAHLVPAVR